MSAAGTARSHPSSPTLPTTLGCPNAVVRAGASMREANGLVPIGPQAFCVCRADDVVALRDDTALSHSVERWSAFPQAALRLPSVRGRLASVLAADGDLHRRLRSALVGALRGVTPARVSEIGSSAATAAFEAVEGRQFDLVDDLARPFASHAMCRLVGIPEELGPELIGLSHRLSPLLALQSTGIRDLLRAESAYRRFVSLLASIDSSSIGEQTVLGRLLASAEPPPALWENVLFFFCAGFETTTDFAAATVLRLIDEREHVQDAVTNGVASAAVTDELLRYQTPVQFTYRVALEPMRVGGTDVAAGSLLALFLGAANRDGGWFDEADRIRFGRDTSAHLAFGVGRHTCLGASVARIWGTVFVTAAVSRLGSLRLAGEVTWRRDLSFMGPQGASMAWTGAEA